MSPMRERYKKFINEYRSSLERTDDVVIAFAAECVAETRARIVVWIRGAETRMDAQKAAGAVSLHPMHEIGQRQACAGIADAIEREEDLK